jgi:VIT1/CCC1 family predicted Fe2+/Mn2+ transporter
MSAPNSPQRAVETAANWMTHAAAMILGVLLMVLAMTFGVTIVGLIVALPVALVGLALLVWGWIPAYRSWRSQA